MKKAVSIKDRDDNRPTLYFPQKKIKVLPGIGKFPAVLKRKEEGVIDCTFKLAAVNADFVYYVDENEGDDSGKCVMLNRRLKFVSDNIFAYNDLTEQVEEKNELLWMSGTIKYWKDQLNDQMSEGGRIFHQTLAQLQADIKEIKNVLKDKDLPEDSRAGIQTALKKAEDMLKNGEYDQPGQKSAPKKSSGKNKERSPLDDCKEILAKSRAAKKKGEERRQKREKAGKPAELTISETIGKAAKSVATKVKKKEQTDKPVTKTETSGSRKKILDLVDGILEGIGPMKDRLAFLHALIEDIRVKVSHEVIAHQKSGGKKAAAGMRMGDGTRSGQLRIYFYKTKNFDICPDAKEYFERILANVDADQYQPLIMTMAKEVDLMLGIVKEVSLNDFATEQQIKFATGYLMGSMYWCYGVLDKIEGRTGDPQKWYPGFLADELYQVALKTGKTIPEAANGMRMTYDEAFEGLTAAQVAQINDSLLNDENSTDEEIIDALEESGVPREKAAYAVNKYRDTFRTNFLLELTNKKQPKPGKITYDGNAASARDKVLNSLTENQLTKINSRMRIEHNIADMGLIHRLITEDGIPPAIAYYVVNYWKNTFATIPGFNLSKSSEKMEKGGMLYYVDRSGDFPVARDEVLNSLSDADVDTINSILANDEEASNEEVINEFIGEGIPPAVARHIVTVWRNLFFQHTLLQLEKTDVKANGGTVKVSDKVNAVAKNLEGKPVEKKYQKQYGKKYSKKTALLAAKRIIGEQMKKGAKKLGKKFLLGGVAIHTPGTIGLLGDHDNLDIHDPI